MRKEFEMSMMRELNFFIGFQIKECQVRIFINQDKYAKELLKKLNLNEVKHTSTPIILTRKLDIDQSGKLRL